MQQNVVTAFTSDSTASQVAATADLEGRYSLVTGAGGALGRATVAALRSAGCRVTVTARNKEAARALAFELCGDPEFGLPLDLMSKASIDACAKAYGDSGRPLHFLINNAGIMGCPLERTREGIESQLQTNVVGPVRLSLRLSNLLGANAPSRIVMVSSAAHHYSPVKLEDLNWEREPYNPSLAYGRSKTAVTLLTVALQRRLATAGITCLAVHPGIIESNLFRFMSEQEREHVEQLKRIQPQAFKTPEAGAATTIWAATEPGLAERGGAYLENCQVAHLIESPNMQSGVVRYAVDPTIAEQLWDALQTLLPSSFPEFEELSA